jgi:signal transduction histidine kinase
VTSPRELSSLWRHDMKNQLGIILGFSDLLLQDMDSGDHRRPDLEEIHGAARRAMDLLAELTPPKDGEQG